MTPQDFELHSPPRMVLLFPLLIGLLLPLGVVVALATGRREPADWLGAAPVLLLPLVGGLLAWSLFRRKVRLSDAGLRIRRLPWPRTVPVAELDLEHAEIVDLQSRPELMPVFKIAGTRLPGFRAGRFRLRDKRHASVLLTRLRGVLVLPLRKGSLLLLSVERPEALLRALQQRDALRRG
jgi:hypothetical protein